MPMNLCLVFAVQVDQYQQPFAGGGVMPEKDKGVSPAGLNHPDIGLVEKSRMGLQQAVYSADSRYLVFLASPIQGTGIMDIDFLGRKPLHAVGKPEAALRGA